MANWLSFAFSLCYSSKRIYAPNGIGCSALTGLGFSVEQQLKVLRNEFSGCCIWSLERVQTPARGDDLQSLGSCPVPLTVTAACTFAIVVAGA